MWVTACPNWRVSWYHRVIWQVRVSVKTQSQLKHRDYQKKGFIRLNHFCLNMKVYFLPITLGHCCFVKHHINLSNEIPFKQTLRRIPPAMTDEVKSHLEQLAATGIIRPSHSPWTSNVVLVRKHDGNLRMCIDYRQLNKRTTKDWYALPRIEEILDTLSGSKYFTVLDMNSGYHQVEVLEKHKSRTAFTVGP